MSAKCCVLYNNKRAKQKRDDKLYCSSVSRVLFCVGAGWGPDRKSGLYCAGLSYIVWATGGPGQKEVTFSDMFRFSEVIEIQKKKKKAVFSGFDHLVGRDDWHALRYSADTDFSFYAVFFTQIVHRALLTCHRCFILPHFFNTGCPVSPYLLAAVVHLIHHFTECLF